MFSVVLSASGPVLMCCAPRFVFGGPEGDRSRFYVLRAGNSFWLYRGRRVPFSCFALPDMFPAIWRVSDLDFMFCAPGHVFSGTEGVRSYFHIFRSRTIFRRYHGHRVPFSCFARRDSFSAVPRASAPVCMFRAPRLLFGGTEGVGSSFNVLLALTRFRQYRGRPVLFSCFALPDIYSAVPSASSHVFKFCAPRLIFGVPKGDGSRLHVLRYRERRVPFSCFA
jgi:hypothetical protein